MMRAGKLDRKMTFQSPFETEDGLGGREDGWTDAFTVRAGYTRLRGTEAVMAARLEGRQPTVIRVRASADTRRIDTDWRAIDTRSGEIFNIRSVIETDDRRWIDITGESGVAT